MTYWLNDQGIILYQNRTLPVSKMNRLVYNGQLLYCKSFIFYSGMRLEQFFAIVHIINPNPQKSLSF